MPRFLLGSLLLAAVACTVTAGEHTKDTLATVKEKVQAKTAVLLDVREQAEWDRGHLRDAKLLPLSELRAGVEKDTVKKLLGEAKIIYCHCAAGKRVLPAADILKKLGYDVRPLREGYADLLKAGFEAAKK
jgi:rhodanese-related sulfurtransferase